jgi:four helix bundle protein
MKKAARTYNEMIQAARSWKQNIVEGRKASGTSKEKEIKLLNVARASLEELLIDYEDFLRVRVCPKWEKIPRKLYL